MYVAYTSESNSVCNSGVATCTSRKSSRRASSAYVNAIDDGAVYRRCVYACIYASARVFVLFTAYARNVFYDACGPAESSTSTVKVRAHRIEPLFVVRDQCT